ncbi:phage tail sheath subtilisin-like domain-containing protein [Longirhabdus pacifica]|uniref:phage tail sheath subtilisin-like domain-containing protein n=1 Tax=Longirhabdus pacifica TaxID=2305227 RepID=UPI0010092D8D|nr:phage tail sheath subtilisin-like domain-containing protein [Longirhabdus pacifica]
MAGGSWDSTALPKRPGLYLNFVEAATAQIQGGARGIIAMPIMTSSGTAVAKTMYTVSKESEAATLFGEGNIQSIKFALQGGAKEVLAYAMETTPDYAAMRDEFDKYEFNVFVFDGTADTSEQASVKTWIETNRSEGKHFMAVLGRSDDSAVPATKEFDEDYIIHLINGVKIEDETHHSAAFAPYIAGLIAGTAINKSITYNQVFVDDVNVRFKHSDIKTALGNGALVLVHDGGRVKIEQGISSSTKKIRAIRARQAVATDITKAAAEAYIGKLNNNEDGQKALIGVIKAYLETLENANVLSDITVELDANQVSEGDSVFLIVGYKEVDSMERIFLNINV